MHSVYNNHIFVLMSLDEEPKEMRDIGRIDEAMHWPRREQGGEHIHTIKRRTHPFFLATFFFSLLHPWETEQTVKSFSSTKANCRLLFSFFSPSFLSLYHPRQPNSRRSDELLKSQSSKPRQYRTAENPNLVTTQLQLQQKADLF